MEESERLERGGGVSRCGEGVKKGKGLKMGRFYEIRMGGWDSIVRGGGRMWAVGLGDGVEGRGGRHWEGGDGRMRAVMDWSVGC